MSFYQTRMENSWYSPVMDWGGRVLIEAVREAVDNIEDNMNVKELQSLDIDSNGFMYSVTFLVGGYGAEWGRTDCYGADVTSRIWSHRWTVPERINYLNKSESR
eukprot:scaffold33647_cov49-Attheya_sp.AAC.3